MQIERLIVGELQENTYIVTIKDNSLIIDPGDEADKIIAFCNNKNIKEILVTHHHFDHIGALSKLEKYYNLRENVSSGLFSYEVIKNPGHSKDSISFYFPKDGIMFTGDFIFLNSIGRCDLDGGDYNEMLNSLKNVLKYPDNTLLCPGHGSPTTLEHEKENFKYYGI